MNRPYDRKRARGVGPLVGQSVAEQGCYFNSFSLVDIATFNWYVNKFTQASFNENLTKKFILEVGGGSSSAYGNLRSIAALPRLGSG